MKKHLCLLHIREIDLEYGWDKKVTYFVKWVLVFVWCVPKAVQDYLSCCVMSCPYGFQILCHSKDFDHFIQCAGRNGTWWTTIAWRSIRYAINQHIIFYRAGICDPNNDKQHEWTIGLFILGNHRYIDSVFGYVILLNEFNRLIDLIR